jgi:hypothetical protein
VNPNDPSLAGQGRPAALRWLWVAAGLAVLIGIGLTVRSAATLRPAEQRLHRKLADLEQVRRLKTEADRQQAVLETFAQRAPRPLSALDALVKANIPEQAGAVRELEPMPAPPGWAVRRTALTLTNVRFDNLDALLTAAEAQDPPWRLAECTIQASTQPDRAAQVELVFEGIEASGAKP